MTLTGIDEKTNLDRLDLLTQRFPFVEWGVLLSDNRMGKHPRYPSPQWIAKLQPYVLPLSGHLCGRWVRDFIEGGTEFTDFLEVHSRLEDLFTRYQLNISHILNKFYSDDIEKLKQTVAHRFPHAKFIIQVGDSGLPHWAEDMPLVDFLFDCSGGRGVVADRWPRADSNNRGYAGGLNPDNLEEQLALIGEAAGNYHVWIDAESGVRTDEVFDLDKVERFLLIAQPYVIS